MNTRIKRDPPKILITENIRALILEVLERGCYMSLATPDDQGICVSDVLYVHVGEFNLYWMQEPNHSPLEPASSVRGAKIVLRQISAPQWQA